MIIVKKITDKDGMEEAFEIRKKVFVEEQMVDPQEEYDEFENSSNHYLAYMDNKPVGTCRWRKTHNGIKLERFAVLAEARGKEAGKSLLLQCLKDVPEESNIYLHAQVQVIPFYEKFGFKTIGNEFTEAEIRHKKMVYTAQ